MAVYEFKGVHVDTGKPVKGFRDADHPQALRVLLRRERILLTEATEEGRRSATREKELGLLRFFRRVGTDEVAIMTRQLATLVRAGVPLVESIDALTQQTENDELTRVLTQVKESVNEGTSFARSLEAHPRVFQPLFVNMVAAGEASGTLESVLERLAEFMEGQSRLRGKVLAALTYPALMTIVGIVMVTVLMVAVVPKVTSIFENLGQELPWYTRLLIFVSETVSGYWWAILGTLALAGWSFRRWKRRPDGRLKWDSFKLKVPIFGTLNLLVALARFTRTLATLLASGVQLLQAMEIGRNVLGNVRLQNVIADAIGSIREGESISNPLKRSGWFPPMVTHMIAVGERTGQLEAMLENVSRAYEAQVDTRVASLTSMLEPLMIVFLGSAVAFIAVAILMPLIQMNQLVQ